MRNVIVTGGSRGLGLAIARRLSRDGYGVVAIARNPTAELEAAMQEAATAGTGALHFRAFDLVNTGETADLVKAVRREHGPIYGLVNNAAIGTSGVLASMSVAHIEQLVQVNVLGPIVLTKHVVRSMMVDGARGGGRIVNMSSIVSATGFSGLSVYSATKSSLIGFTKSLAREVGRLGVTVNAVAPGFVDTAMTEDMDEAQREQVMRRSALRRMAEAEDIAGAVSFLVSDEARNITGTVLTVDAGSTA